MLTYWETLIAARSNITVSDSYAKLWGRKLSNAYTVATYTGTLPATLQTVGGYLESYKIHGNTEQTGTPTPENPIMPSGCGERTENLFDLSSYYEVSSLISGIIIEKNRITYNAPRQYLAIKYKFTLGIADVYTISLGADSLNIRLELRYAKNGEYVGRTIVINPNQKATVRGGNEYDGFYVYISNFTNTGICTASNIVLNLGSTALPYEPYGYKLPLAVNGEECPIYLGEVETTRRIKKLVLTGEEQFLPHQTIESWFQLFLSHIIINNLELCTHYKPSPSSSAAIIQNGEILAQKQTGSGNGRIIIRDTAYTTANDFKSYLAAQYAAGTPVTVWYVLAEPETGIVNEPLMKIGDYADTIDSTQTSAQIPTAAGETTISWAGEGLAPSEVELVYKVKR